MLFIIYNNSIKIQLFLLLSKFCFFFLFEKHVMSKCMFCSQYLGIKYSKNRFSVCVVQNSFWRRKIYTATEANENKLGDFSQQ